LSTEAQLCRFGVADVPFCTSTWWQVLPCRECDKLLNLIEGFDDRT